MKRTLSLILILAVITALLVQLTSCTLVYDLFGELKFRGIEGSPDGAVEVYAAKDKSITEIEIPREYGGNPVLGIGARAFEDCMDLTRVEIPDTVTKIGNDAFWRCESLTEITIPASVTEIGTCAFFGCTSLLGFKVAPGNERYEARDGVLFDKLDGVLVAYPTGRCDATYTVPDGTTSIGAYAFAKNSHLTDVTLPDGVTAIEDRAFMQCGALRSADIGKGLTRLGYAPFSENADNFAIYFRGTLAEWAAVEIYSDDLITLAKPVFFVPDAPDGILPGGDTPTVDIEL